MNNKLLLLSLLNDIYGRQHIYNDFNLRNQMNARKLQQKIQHGTIWRDLNDFKQSKTWTPYIAGATVALLLTAGIVSIDYNNNPDNYLCLRRIASSYTDRDSSLTTVKRLKKEFGITCEPNSDPSFTDAVKNVGGNILSQSIGKTLHGIEYIVDKQHHDINQQLSEALIVEKTESSEDNTQPESSEKRNQTSLVPTKPNEEHNRQMWALSYDSLNASTNLMILRSGCWLMDASTYNRILLIVSTYMHDLSDIFKMQIQLTAAPDDKLPIMINRYGAELLSQILRAVDSQIINQQVDFMQCYTLISAILIRFNNRLKDYKGKPKTSLMKSTQNIIAIVNSRNMKELLRILHFIAPAVLNKFSIIMNAETENPNAWNELGAITWNECKRAVGVKSWRTVPYSLLITGKNYIETAVSKPDASNIVKYTYVGLNHPYTKAHIEIVQQHPILAYTTVGIVGLIMLNNMILTIMSNIAFNMQVLSMAYIFFMTMVNSEIIYNSIVFPVYNGVHKSSIIIYNSIVSPVYNDVHKNSMYIYQCLCSSLISLCGPV